MLGMAEEVEIRVSVHVNEPWGQVVTFCLDHAGVGRGSNAGLDLLDDARSYEHVRLEWNCALIAIHDRGPAKEDTGSVRCRSHCWFRVYCGMDCRQSILSQSIVLMRGVSGAR